MKCWIQHSLKSLPCLALYSSAWGPSLIAGVYRLIPKCGSNWHLWAKLPTDGGTGRCTRWASLMPGAGLQRSELHIRGQETCFLIPALLCGAQWLSKTPDCSAASGPRLKTETPSPAYPVVSWCWAVVARSSGLTLAGWRGQWFARVLSSLLPGWSCGSCSR